MTEAFDVTEEYTENEVPRFVALGRLQFNIDCVAGMVVTSNYLNDDETGIKLPEDMSEATHEREIMHQNTVKTGDHLHKQLRKFSKVMYL
jgi:hypothetical protein